MSRLTRANLNNLLAQPLAKRIDQKAIEKWAAAFWDLARQASASQERPNRGPFIMMFPPPNITGNLHLGHALTGAVQDALIRHRRMQGYACTFVPGFDHAGLATQSIVEKLLWKQKGISRQELGRDEFINLVYQWKNKKLSEMRAQLDKLGLELNHEKEYFTMDENSSFAVQTAFKQLFNSGLVYRANRQIFWCNSLQTTLSDIEVEQVGGQFRYTRTGEIVERRPLSQWFINAKSMARKAVEAVNDGSIVIIPPNYKRTWSAWLLDNGVQDWCISRQSWWGHRIPAYKLESAADIGENWVVADDLSQAQSKLGSTENVQQDSDVLDTWFSSSLLPLTISGWPDCDKFEASCRSLHFPLHIMETGFDILTYWVSKMTMISLALTGKVPFKMVLLHGMICDSEGKKMSKSLGNVIDPLDVIDGATLHQLQARTNEAHSQGILEDKQLQSVLDKQKQLFPNGIPPCGADGLRAYLLSHDIHEEVVRVQIAQIEKVRRLSNKIWNIFRLFLTTLDRYASNGVNISLKMDVQGIAEFKLDPDDQQVLREMSRCVCAAEKSFCDTYQLHQCFNRLEIFLIEHLSQSYIQQIKGVLGPGDMSMGEDRRRKLEVLATCLLTSIKILHPYMPHLSEFLFQKLVMHAESCKSGPDDDEPKFRLLSNETFPGRCHWAGFSSDD
jgi:valyl-tRNA synthetase